MTSLRTLACGGWIVLFAIAAGAQAQEKQLVGKGIDPATVDAYEKLGATYGIGVDSLIFSFQESASRSLPSFKFRSDPKELLPDVSIPFGLTFFGTKVTDAGMKELAGLTQLHTLSLSGTQVTGAGLKELKKTLPSLRIVD